MKETHSFKSKIFKKKEIITLFYMFQTMKGLTLQNSLLPSRCQTQGEYTKTNCTLYLHPQIILHQQI